LARRRRYGWSLPSFSREVAVRRAHTALFGCSQPSSAKGEAEPDRGGLPGLETPGKAVRFVGEALDRGFGPFRGLVGVAQQTVDNPGDGGRGDAGVHGDVPDGYHWFSLASTAVWRQIRKRFT
jgi:hypothetical protein